MGHRPITIVVPVYNGGSWLLECLRSIQLQSYPWWQCIVVDDGSTRDRPQDTSPELRDPRVNLVRHHVNRGLAAARNTGFRAAGTEWVLPVDADDQLHPEFLSSVLTEVDTFPEVDSVHTDFQLFGGSEGTWQFPLRTPADMARHQWIPGPGTLMRKQLWLDVGGWDEHQAFRSGGNEDWDFWLGAMVRGLRSARVPRPLYLYRRSPESMSVTGGLLYDHISRACMARKHHLFFEQHGARRYFLANGFLRSATAWRKRGHPWRGTVQALRGLVRNPRHRELWQAAVGETIWRWARRMKHWLRPSEPDA